MKKKIVNNCYVTNSYKDYNHLRFRPVSKKHNHNTPDIQSVNNTNPVKKRYNVRQWGCLWILFIFLSYICFMVAMNINIIDCTSSLLRVFLFYCSTQCLFWGISTIWLNIEDCGDYLLIRHGPCRWMSNGLGREKVQYTEIKSYDTTFGFRCFDKVKVFNTCSCCCGYNAKCCCCQKTIRLKIKDGDECCWETFCISYCGGCNSGCYNFVCCDVCCFCCRNIHSIFISTNDADGLIALLNEKCTHIQYADI